MKISLCIPMYNESSIAAATVRKVHAAMEKLREERGLEYEVLFSDDGSLDDCADIVRKTAEEIGSSRIRVTGYKPNRGKGAAVRHAVLESCGDVVIYTDCDLAYGTDVVGEAVSYFERDTAPDMVIGSRNISGDGYEGYTFLRRVASKIYIKVLCIAAGFRLSDSQCGFKALTGAAAHRVFPLVETDGFAFDLEVILNALKLGCSIEEMPVKIVNHRESKVNVLSDSVKMLKDLRKIKKRIRKRG